MILNIRLKNIDPANYTEELVRQALDVTAQELMLLNKLPALSADPIKVTPSVTDDAGTSDLLTKPIESFLGDCNTPPTQWGDVAIQINNYRWLELPPEVTPQTFSITLGRPERKTVDADGNPVTVSIGGIAGAPAEVTTL